MFLDPLSLMDVFLMEVKGEKTDIFLGREWTNFYLFLNIFIIPLSIKVGN